MISDCGGYRRGEEQHTWQTPSPHQTHAPTPIRTDRLWLLLHLLVKDNNTMKCCTVSSSRASLLQPNPKRLLGTECHVTAARTERDTNDTLRRSRRKRCGTKAVTIRASERISDSSVGWSRPNGVFGVEGGVRSLSNDTAEYWKSLSPEVIILLSRYTDCMLAKVGVAESRRRAVLDTYCFLQSAYLACSFRLFPLRFDMDAARNLNLRFFSGFMQVAF
jgi:hypothetical protein